MIFNVPGQEIPYCPESYIFLLDLQIQYDPNQNLTRDLVDFILRIFKTDSKFYIVTQKTNHEQHNIKRKSKLENWYYSISIHAKKLELSRQCGFAIVVQIWSVSQNSVHSEAGYLVSNWIMEPLNSSGYSSTGELNSCVVGRWA